MNTAQQIEAEGWKSDYAKATNRAYEARKAYERERDAHAETRELLDQALRLLAMPEQEVRKLVDLLRRSK